MQNESTQQGTATTAAAATPSLELLKHIELPVTLRFGGARLSLRDLSSLNMGAVIELDRALSEPVEVLVGGFVIARGQPVVVQGVYGVRISEIASRQELVTMSAVAAGGDQ